MSAIWVGSAIVALAVGNLAVVLALLALESGLTLLALEEVVATLEPVHLVGAGGALGATCRHLVYERLEADGFPAATFAVNVCGSVALGLVVFAGAGERAVAFLGTGFCGAFTTFSTFSVETVRLWEDGNRRLAAANALANLLCSLGGVGLAWTVVAVT